MVHQPFIPLIAAGIDWLEGLLPLLFVVFWIVSQIVGVIRRVAGGGEAARQPAPRPRPAAGDARPELERQIEEFLRQERGGQPPPLPPARRPEPRRPERRTNVKRPPVPPVAARPAAAPKPGGPRLTDRHIEPLAAAGADIGAHVKDAFSRDLGHLASSLAPAAMDATAAPSAPRGTTAELAAALRDPASLRRLILIREILDRPVDRWE